MAKETTIDAPVEAPVADTEVQLSDAEQDALLGVAADNETTSSVAPAAGDETDESRSWGLEGDVD